jgi:hypothetical protein
MHRHVFALIVVIPAVALSDPAASAPKKVAYPEVRVNVAAAFRPDAPFSAMRKLLSDAIAKKDAAALFNLVGPTFVWTTQGVTVDDFDMGRDALHNFKVVFGFRRIGSDTDGGVENGPYWDALAAFAADGTYEAENRNLVCGPIAAGVADPKVFEEARSKIETADEPVDWYFTLSDTRVATAPRDTGPPVATVGQVALPVLSVYPPSPDGKPAVAPTHLEVLLSTGKTGWIPVAAARALAHTQLCYAKTPKGDWKVVAYDQPEG